MFWFCFFSIFMRLCSFSFWLVPFFLYLGSQAPNQEEYIFTLMCEWLYSENQIWILPVFITTTTLIQDLNWGPSLTDLETQNFLHDSLYEAILGLQNWTHAQKFKWRFVIVSIASEMNCAEMFLIIMDVAHRLEGACQC